jgi:hypothetical protein
MKINLVRILVVLACSIVLPSVVLAQRGPTLRTTTTTRPPPTPPDKNSYCDTTSFRCVVATAPNFNPKYKGAICSDDKECGKKVCDGTYCTRRAFNSANRECTQDDQCGRLGCEVTSPGTAYCRRVTLDSSAPSCTENADCYKNICEEVPATGATPISWRCKKDAVIGQGNECTEDSGASGCQHKKCGFGGICNIVEGPGTDTCSKNEDCTLSTPQPSQSPSPSAQ